MASRKKPLKSSRQSRHWSLLLIGGHGETITIGRIKGLIIILAIVAATMFVAALVLFYSNRRFVVTNANLKNSLTEMTSRLVSLRNDRDLYMTRLVAVESMIEGLREARGEKPMPADSPETGKADHRLEETGISERVRGETAPAIESSGPNKDVGIAAVQSCLDVENFTLTYEPSLQTLRIGYRIKITDHLVEHINGRTIAVLKSGEMDRFNWLTLPEIELDKGGQPVNWQKGQLFSISNFRDIVFETKSQYPAKEFTLATVFVFSETGDLFLEKDFFLNGE